MGELLEENIATFRCYDNISLAKYYVSPTPLQELADKGSFKTSLVVHKQTVGASLKDLLLLSRARVHHQDPTR